MTGSPRRNRVTPLGELVAVPDRGLVYGNRGCLHDAAGEIRRHHATRRWIACRLRFRGWHRHPLMQPGRFTELFFLDDATALAAGHRPCALCRRADHEVLAGIWRQLHPDDRGATAIDARLHAERWLPAGGRRLHRVALASLPDGAFVMHDGRPHLVLDGALRPWSASGYGAAVAAPEVRRVAAITPPSLCALLAAGYRPLVPLLHGSAGQSARPAAYPSATTSSPAAIEPARFSAAATRSPSSSSRSVS